MQAALTVICAVVAGLIGGLPSALSAFLGGMVVLASSVAFGAAFFWRAGRRGGKPEGNAGRALRTVLFAEALKWMTAIGGLLWLLRTLPFDTQAGPVVAGFVVALIGSWLALLTKT